MTHKLGLIGAGAIGTAVIQALNSQLVAGYELAGVFDIAMNDLTRELLAVSLTPIATTVDALIQMQPDLILEAAGHGAVADYGAQILRNGINFLPMSVGAFADEPLYEELQTLARQNRVQIFIPSGAIGALDVLRAGRARNDLAKVTLTSTKKPAALAGQPYFQERGIRVEDLTEVTTVFEGSARVACREFPKSTNIAASISLAGLGFDRTTVKMVADPNTSRTVHSLEAIGAFGELQLNLQNMPHPENPSTTYLACLGAIAALINKDANVQFV